MKCPQARSIIRGKVSLFKERGSTVGGYYQIFWGSKSVSQSVCYQHGVLMHMLHAVAVTTALLPTPAHAHHHHHHHHPVASFLDPILELEWDFVVALIEYTYILARWGRGIQTAAIALRNLICSANSYSLVAHSRSLADCWLERCSVVSTSSSAGRTPGSTMY